MQIIFGEFDRNRAFRSEGFQSQARWPGLECCFSGRLDNSEELGQQLELLNKNISSAELVLASYKKWGDKAFARLKGDYVFAVFESLLSRLYVVRDKIGVVPCYFAYRPRHLWFSTYLKPLVDLPDYMAEPDFKAISSYLMIGSGVFADRELTPFKGIYSVLPGHFLEVTKGKVKQSPYWDFDLEKSIKFNNHEEYVQQFQSHFKKAVQRRMATEGKTAVSVSGGLDSSSIFCQALQLGPVQGFSYVSTQGEPSDEVKYLDAIESQYGVKIERISIKENQGFREFLGEQIRAIEVPFVDYMWNVLGELNRRTGQAGCQKLLTGHWGDQVLFSPAYLVDEYWAGHWLRVRRDLKEYHNWYVKDEAEAYGNHYKALLKRSFVPRSLYPAAKRAKRWWAGDQRRKSGLLSYKMTQLLAPTDDWLHLLDSAHSVHTRQLYLQARSKYYIQSLEWDFKFSQNYGLDMAFVFLDEDLVQFLMAIPGGVMTRKGVPRGLFRDAMAGVLPEPIRNRTWKADFSHVVNETIVQELSSIVSELLNRPLLIETGIVEAKAFKEYLQNIKLDPTAENCEGSWQLADFLGLEMWLREYFYGNKNKSIKSAGGGYEESGGQKKTLSTA